jgi:molecular chaperone HscB
MTPCWSCERDPGTGLGCASCGALTAPVPGETLFETLGLPLRYEVDLVAAEAVFKARARLVHPDRFGRADPRARQISMRRTVQLNEAWRTIRHPIRRAEYLLGLLGYDVGAEEGATGLAAPGPAAAGRQTGPRVRIPVSPVLLNDVLEAREALAEARAAGDASTVRRLAGDVEGQLARALRAVADGFEAVLGRAGGPSQPADHASDHASEHAGGQIVHPGTAASDLARQKEKLDAVAEQLIAIRYHQRFLDEIGATEPDLPELSVPLGGP